MLNTLFFDYLLENDVPEDHIIRFAFDSAEDLELIGEDIVKLQKENKRVDPKKFMNYVRSRCVDKDKYYLLLDEVQFVNATEFVYQGRY